MSYLRRAFLGLNGLSLLLMVAWVAYAKSSGHSAKELFQHPQLYPHFTVGSLTHLFQMLCSIPPILCFFTYSLLRMVGTKGAEIRFILASALVTGGFWVNEIYRIHIYLSRGGLHKPLVILIYTIGLVIYGINFRQQLLKTPYPIVLIGMGILSVGIGIDALRLPDQNLTDFLEGVPKVLSMVNVTLYFWCVCLRSILLAGWERAR
jgi:hypothetical protein